MIGTRETLLSALLTLAGAASLAQTPFDLLTSDTRLLVEVPPGFDLRTGTGTLTVGVDLDTGDTTAHTAQLQYLSEADNGALRLFAIAPEDVAAFEVVLDRMAEWRAQGLHGTSNFRMEVGACLTGAEPSGDAALLFGMFLDGQPDSMRAFGGMNLTGPEADPAFADGIEPCGSFEDDGS